MGKGEYESIICVDLRSFDRTAEDMGVNAYFKQLGFVPTGLCFLNFQVMYLFDFENVDDRELDPISFDYIHSVLRSKGVFGDFVKYHQCSMEKYPVSLGVSGSSSDDARRIALMG